MKTPTRKKKKIVTSVSPFLKWAGGKSQLLPQLTPLFPKQFNKYLEPFLGGGAVFFHLHSLKKVKKAILIDTNQELIDCYASIKNNVQELIDTIERHKKEYQAFNSKYYYFVRNEVRNNADKWQSLSQAERGAITIFLNKTCFNGLYRVNSKNQFNAPEGRYKNPAVYDADNLKAISKVLKKVEIIKGDFGDCLKYAKKDDFIYFDPPYNPLTETANFTGYTKGGFGDPEQQRLSEVYRALDKRGCKVMLSNSATRLIKGLYKGYKIKKVKASRLINCKSTGRGKINEYVVLNY